MSSSSRPASVANPVAALPQQYGQSVWFDYIRRSLIEQGELKRMVDEDALGGVTSNPAIFEKAIDGSNDYATAIAEISKDAGLSSKEVYERLAVDDIQDAADVLRVVYDRTKAQDGYVSLEVSPDLAKDTKGTLDEARRLWATVNRPNVMIKVPATAEGIPAIRTLISEGINVNVTLLFAREAYEAVAHAYIEGLEARAKSGQPLGHVASVASFFVSRIDSLVDGQLAEKLKTATGADKARLESLVGKVAIANAKMAYQSFKRIFSGPAWEALAAKGAHGPARALGQHRHQEPGLPRRDLHRGADRAGHREHGAAGHAVGVPRPRPAPRQPRGRPGRRQGHPRQPREGGRLPEQGHERAARGRAQEVRRALHEAPEGGRAALPRGQQGAHQRPELSALRRARRRGEEEARRVGRARGHPPALRGRRVAVVGHRRGELAGMARHRGRRDRTRSPPLNALRDEVKGFTHAVVLGMGGSSMCPEVWKETFGRIPGHPELHILDSTDPAQVKAVEDKVDLAKTLFIVASKSGSTLEPNIFKAYFFDRVKQVVGADKAKGHFIAVTDPGSNLEKEAKADGFRHVFSGVKSIGGRYSALSNFGMVPAAVMGLDVEKLLDEAERMQQACMPGVPAAENPGLVLGTILGCLALRGVDKLTLVASPGVHDLGAWLEQLIAESTGKEGKGIIPVDRERVGPPSAYGEDRLFCYLRLESAPDAAQDAAVAALEKAGKPVVRISVATPYDLGEEFFRWEVATAIAGSILGINAFNQPDVEASKIATRTLTNEYEKTGALPKEAPFFEGEGVKLFADAVNAEALQKAAGSDRSLASLIKAHLGRLGAGDYFATLAYVPMTAAHEETIQGFRHRVRDAKRVATCLGFGPRFLHSTGQGYKGGPNTGVFLQITCDDAKDLAVPGQKYTFGIVKAAQARGDFQVLSDRKRRALRVHLGPDVAAGLKTLDAAIRKALG